MYMQKKIISVTHKKYKQVCAVCPTSGLHVAMSIVTNECVNSIVGEEVINFHL